MIIYSYRTFSSTKLFAYAPTFPLLNFMAINSKEINDRLGFIKKLENNITL